MVSGTSGRTAPLRHNLPAEIASFVGRERERATIDAMLRHDRLVTLTGPGGVGKTRLAVRAAADVAPGFADGVIFVPLAPLTEGALVGRTVAATLGIRAPAGQSELGTLATALAARRLLLVLDNCEHVIGAAARLAEELLRACHHVRILATSREPLRIAGEVTFRVPPLGLPPAQSSPDAPVQSDAVALFLERARARRPDFALTVESTASVVAICRHLDGLPLGIELAAAQLGVMSPEQIASRLDDSLRLPAAGSRTEPRHATLDATLDWSYALLSEAERMLLRRLAVFAGGFDLVAAEDVGSGGGLDRGDVLSMLGSLVEKSLVESQLQGREARYRLLEPVHQYARTRLDREGEATTIEQRHAHYFLGLAESLELALMSGRRGPALDRLALEGDNLRVALTRCRDGAPGDIAAGLRLAGALMWYWSLRGESNEGLQWIETLLARASDAPPAIRAKAAYAACELAWLAGNTALARIRAEESAALFRMLGDKRWLAYTLQSLPMAIDNPASRVAVDESLRLFEEIGDTWGATLAMGGVDLFALVRDGDPDGTGQARLESALLQSRTLGDDWLSAQILNILGDLARSRGDAAAAEACYEESLALLRSQGLTGTVPSLLHNLGHLALGRSDIRRARRLFREGLEHFRNQGDQRGMADCLDGLAGVLGGMNLPEPAARLFGAADTLRAAIGATVWPGNLATYERSIAVVRAQLEETAFTAAWAAGRATPLAEIVAAALATPAEDGQPMDRSGLTPREREVVKLVAQGLTNRQIGAQLFITEGTARLHVKHILAKLDLTSRTQIALWVREQPPPVS